VPSVPWLLRFGRAGEGKVPRSSPLLNNFSITTWLAVSPKKERKKNHASSRKLLTSFKEKGPLGKKSPFTTKEKGGSVSPY